MEATKLVNKVGRISHVERSYAFIAVQKVGGLVMMQPTSSKLACYDLTAVFNTNDIVKFSALPYDGKNSVKYFAIDGTVMRTSKAADAEIKGLGTVTYIQRDLATFGFIKTQDQSSVFFNANSVMPKCKKIDTVLSFGEQVNYVAIPQVDQSNCKYRATRVVAISHADNHAHAGESRPTSTDPPSCASSRSRQSSVSDDILHQWEESAVESQCTFLTNSPKMENDSNNTSSSSSQVKITQNGNDEYPLWIAQAPAQALTRPYSDQVDKIIDLTNYWLGWGCNNEQ